MFKNFNLNKNHYIYLIGGGGKTTLMFALAEYLVGMGKSVLCSTSTKVRGSEIVDRGSCLVLKNEKKIDALFHFVQEGINTHKRVFVAKEEIKENKKLQGLSASDLDILYESKVADYIIVEADGSKGRYLKAHADFEPVVSKKADLIVIVWGKEIIGMPINEDNVHRSDLFCEYLNKNQGDIITEQDITNIIFHKKGYLKGVGNNTEVMCYPTIRSPSTRSSLRASSGSQAPRP